MDENDDIANLIEEFNVTENDTIAPSLDKFIEHIAATGLTRFPWCKLKKLIAWKLDIAIKQFQERAPVLSETVGGVNTDSVAFKDMKQQLIESIFKFNGAPFTIQRLCELLMNPAKVYKTTEKFMRGIEKNLLVVSTVDECGNQVFNEPRVHQDVETMESESSAHAASIEGSPFLTPLSPGLVHASQNSVVRTKLSWSSRNIPNVFDSPSLRGVVASANNCHRRPSPLPSEPLSRKRQRKDWDDIDEESEYQSQSYEKYPRLSSRLDETSLTLQPKMAPILGQLLCNADSKDSKDCEDCKDDGAETNNLVATNSEEIADSITVIDCDTIQNLEILVGCEKAMDLNRCNYDNTTDTSTTTKVDYDVVTDSDVVDGDPNMNSEGLVGHNRKDMVDSHAITSAGLKENNSKELNVQSEYSDGPESDVTTDCVSETELLLPELEDTAHNTVLDLDSVSSQTAHNTVLDLDSLSSVSSETAHNTVLDLDSVSSK